MRDWSSLRPPSRCPKCGYDRGFTYAKPYYGASGDREYLSWACSLCYYEIQTETADNNDDWDDIRRRGG